MNSRFYMKMAKSNLSKNSKTYVPYILMGIFIVTMYFMISSLYKSKEIINMDHGENVVLLLGVGMWVIRIFSVIFLFYINSFLIKRRKQEIGLYNILGMEKRHIGIMMYVETVYIMLIDIAAGIILGIVFGKLMFLLLFKLIKSQSIPAFAIPADSLTETIIFFIALFSVIFIYNLMKIHLTNPIEMLHGGEIGEKEPKTKLIITAIGLLTMGWGYYFALMYKQPLKVMNTFMIAIVAVIIGTYCLFTSGSIAVIKILKRNKRIYYRPNNFTILSGMLYRMKQNAVGMANICILSTMVLISVSTTVCLYAGMEDSITSAYPREIIVTSYMDEADSEDEINKIVEDVNKKFSVKEKNKVETHILELFFRNTEKENAELCDGGNLNALTEGNIVINELIPLSDYNKVSGKKYELKDDEVLVFTKNGKEIKNLKFNVNNSNYDFSVKKILDSMDKSLYDTSEESFMDVNVIVVKDISIMNEIYSNVRNLEGKVSLYYYKVLYNTNLNVKESKRLSDEINIYNNGDKFIYTENQYLMREELNMMYGGFLFIGIFVSIIFLMATALIIYYKQISEGYDDREKFIIMQKVGMSSDEVKKNIKIQVMMVFILPLIVAAIHVAVAFRIFKIILQMLSFSNAHLFGLCTLGTLGVFAIIYVIMFMVTSKSYYKIVSYN